jgi:hypothetical protein
MSVRLIQGDCRDVLRTLDENSVDAVMVLSGAGLPFDRHMAGMAKGHDVVHRIGVVRHRERRNRPNVVHIELAPKVALTDAAPLTRVPVSLSRCTLQWPPVWTVVGAISAAPSGVLIGATVGIAAIKRAKAQTTLTLVRLEVIELPTTIRARFPMVDATALWSTRRCNQGSLSFGRVAVGLRDNALGEAKRPTGKVTGARAENGAMPGSGAGPAALNRLAACRTRQAHRTTQSLSSKRIRAGPAARGLSPVLQASRIGQVLDFADRTNALNHGWGNYNARMGQGSRASVWKGGWGS